LDNNATKLATLYVSRSLLNAEELKNWAISQGFKSNLLVPDMHVTICYSKTEVDWSRIRPLKNKFINKRSERSIDNFKDSVYVLRFGSELLWKRWHTFIDIGATTDFVPYKPHVSLTYNQKDLDISTITPYEGELIFGAEIFTEVN
jgi:hypothetical protein